ncbi:MAG: hypothetical protein J0L77_07435 [Alphaproteobacteria bacterium]|nr:hypothetical protein [Alphaproteobacteria bacterium]
MSVDPSKDQLEKMKEHIEYEYKMLIHSGTRFLELSQDPTSNANDKNAYLECFLLHLRVLDEFFSFKHEGKSEKEKKSKKDKRDDDVLVTHYSKQKFGALLTDVERENVNKRLAHLTLIRLENKDNWPIDDLINKAEASWKKLQEIM